MTEQSGQADQSGQPGQQGRPDPQRRPDAQRPAETQGRSDAQRRQARSAPGGDIFNDLQRWFIRQSAKNMRREIGGQVRKTFGGRTESSDVWDVATTEIPPEVGESPECQWCPICRAARRMREGGPGLGGQVQGAGDAVAGAVQDAISALDGFLGKLSSAGQHPGSGPGQSGARSGQSRPAAWQAGGRPGAGQPAAGQPGAGQPGAGQPGTGPAAAGRAAARDPWHSATAADADAAATAADAGDAGDAETETGPAEPGTRAAPAQPDWRGHGSDDRG